VSCLPRFGTAFLEHPVVSFDITQALLRSHELATKRLFAQLRPNTASLSELLRQADFDSDRTEPSGRLRSADFRVRGLLLFGKAICGEQIPNRYCSEARRASIAGPRSFPTNDIKPPRALLVAAVRAGFLITRPFLWRKKKPATVCRCCRLKEIVTRCLDDLSGSPI
jgi:hypothetical protein